VLTSSTYLDVFESHSGIALPVTSPLVPGDSALISNSYKIESILKSENALILFTQCMTAPERFVMKVLRDYQDTRYNLETRDKRQQCQLEALQRNRIYTPEIYLGLARIFDFSTSSDYIRIGELIENPSKEMLDPDAEYALLMEQLPDNRRLDILLQTKDTAFVQHLVRVLAEYVAQMHVDLTPSLSLEEASHWGSYKQLYNKLLENLQLLDLVPTVSRDDERICAKERIDCLRKRFLELFFQPQYPDYFEQRIQPRRIKCCHGDIKSPNIWIVPGRDGENGQCIKILDAIDFNPLFSNIDILSDFAMLVIDIQTRTHSSALADAMIDHYLNITDQDEPVARAVLGYYLVEKAIVGAAISILYDDMPDLGLSLLEVAEIRINCLMDLWR
jgi:aminoglycoside phosphotransferase family enzyme